MGITFRVSMYITSFFPLWLCIAFNDFISLLNGKENKITEFISVLVIFVANALSVPYLLIAIRKATKKGPCEFEKREDVFVISARKGKTITTEYLLSTVLPLFAFDFTLWKQVILFLIYFMTLSFLSIKNGNVYANLLFELKGYSFFTCDINIEGVQLDDVVLISKKNLQSSLGHRISIAKMGYPFYIETD